MRSGSVWTRSADDRLMRTFGDGDDAGLQELFIRFGPRRLRDRISLLPQSRRCGCVQRAHLRDDVAPIFANASSAIDLQGRRTNDVCTTSMG
jgi:hypothetical protein